MATLLRAFGPYLLRLELLRLEVLRLELLRLERVDEAAVRGREGDEARAEAVRFVRAVVLFEEDRPLVAAARDELFADARRDGALADFAFADADLALGDRAFADAERVLGDRAVADAERLLDALLVPLLLAVLLLDVLAIRTLSVDRISRTELRCIFCAILFRRPKEVLGLREQDLCGSAHRA